MRRVQISDGGHGGSAGSKIDEIVEQTSIYMRYTPLSAVNLRRTKTLVATLKKQRAELTEAGVTTSHVGLAKSLKRCQFEGCDAEMNRKCMTCPSSKCGLEQEKGYHIATHGKRKRPPTD